MIEDSCNLLALCDMTNLPSKRGISSILGDLLLKSGGDDSGVVAPTREGGSGVKFSKRLCLVVDDLVKESTRTSDDDDDDDDTKTIIASGDGDESTENLELVDVKESQGETNVEGGEISVQDLKCEKDLDTNVFSSQTDDAVVINNTTTTTGEGLAMTMFSNNNSQTDDDIKNHDIKSFSMKRCSNVGIVNHHHQDLEVDDEELKSCSCSFCLKAAYIWSDLHYQDIKGRLSVLKKSQKEASNLIQRNGKEGKTTDNNFDVMGQWTTLFLSMQGILASESNHLQNSFVTMKELRENCKIDLEKSTKTPQHNNNNNNNNRNT